MLPLEATFNLNIYANMSESSLRAINKSGLYSGVLTLKARLVNEYNELSNIVEVNSREYTDKTYQGTIYPIIYCDTPDFKKDTSADAKAHWYITNVDMYEDGATYITLARDVLWDFYTKYYGDPVIITSETNPTTYKTTQLNGQVITYTETDSTARLRQMFPYALSSPLVGEDWTSKRNIVLSILSDRDRALKNQSGFYTSSVIGRTAYAINFQVASSLIRSISSNESLWLSLAKWVTGNNLSEAIPSINKAPFDLPFNLLGASDQSPYTDSDDYDYEERDGVIYPRIPIGRGISVSPETPLSDNKYTYLTRCIYINDSVGTIETIGDVQLAPTSNYGVRSLGKPLIYTYNLGECDKLELMLPFVGHIDLTPYLRYFNGVVACYYAIDTLTGDGVLGLSRSSTLSFKTFDTISGRASFDKFDLVYPFNCYNTVEWAGVQTNKAERLVGALTSLAGGVNSNSLLSASSSLVKGSTDIIHRAGDSNQDINTMVSTGKFTFYGARKTLRTRGLVNNSINNERVLFGDLEFVEVLRAPTIEQANAYNVITVDIVKRAWTGNADIDNTIYEKLTQGGFIFNGD